VGVVPRDDGGNFKQYQRPGQQLMDVLELKEQIIDGLRDEIDKRKKREGDLREN
jgi:phosphoglycerate-specific signal transduction histidine kinase